MSAMASPTPKRAPAEEARTLTVAIGIATRGRPGILGETLADLAGQSCPAACVLVAYSEPVDIGNAPEQFPGVRFIQGTSGSCVQRNRLLESAEGSYDLILFMDDDFYLHRDYLLRMEEVFRTRPDVQGATGKVIADGAVGPGLTVEHARTTIRAIGHVPHAGERSPTKVFNTYGCNMAFRLTTVKRHGLRFDENLPAYGWYEDIDFSRRFLPFGALVEVAGAQGVHLGVKVGRTSGKRLGYSQVANPIYLARKGSYTWFRATGSIARRLLSNCIRSLRPESYLDRRGRMHGNLLALWELAAGRLRPDRILEIR